LGYTSPVTWILLHVQLAGISFDQGLCWGFEGLSEAGLATIELRDDRVLLYTRVLSLLIVPFLLVAFVVLYFFPGDTKRLFAWTISPTMTPMLLASAYLGGAYFFLRVLRERRWNVVKTGFVSVALFASLLGVATILHWDKFNHRHVAFWLWTGLYFSAPFLVTGGWLANRRFAAAVGVDERRLGGITRWIVAATGIIALIQGLVMFLAPSQVIAIWPWPLTPLTCRVVGAIFCLGSAGIAVLVDPRWTTLKLMLQVEVLMVTLTLVGVVRARTEFDPGRPLTWLLLGGFLAVLVGSMYLWYAMERRPRRTDRPGLATG
jgi:hypothetical protein